MERFTVLVPLSENSFNPLKDLGIPPNVRMMVKDQVTRLNFIVSRGMFGWEAFVATGEDIFGNLDGQWVNCTTSESQEECLAMLAEHLDCGEGPHTILCDPIHHC